MTAEGTASHYDTDILLWSERQAELLRRRAANSVRLGQPRRGPGLDGHHHNATPPAGPTFCCGMMTFLPTWPPRRSGAASSLVAQRPWKEPNFGVSGAVWGNRH